MWVWGSYDCQQNSWESMWWVRVCCLWRRLPEALKPAGYPLSFYMSWFLSRLFETTVRTLSAGQPNLTCTIQMGQSLITVVFWSLYEALACHRDTLQHLHNDSIT